jgi:polysaccharide chain length determinant protein (PEP-CTERM system associated)
METSEYLEILLRRKWYILSSIVIILFGASVYCVVTPEMFKSSTTILVVAQRVPEGYVRSTITARVEERLSTISQQVLSRTRLLAVMEEIGLYKEERKKLPAEEVVEMMRKSVDIQVASATGSGGRRRDSSEDAFTLTVTHENPQLAMLTASRLASYFIDENLKSREQQAVGTSEFLESQLQETKVRLEAQEEKVKRYKMQFMGELPQQLQANLQILSRLQEQLKMNSDGIRTARDRKVFIEAQIGAFEAQLGAVRAQVPVSGGFEAPVSSNDTTISIANELAEKQSQLSALSSKYTELYPEIRRLKGEITQLEKRLEEANRNEGGARTAAGTSPRRPVSGGAISRTIPGAREREEILRLRAQNTAIDSEIASLRKERFEIERNIAEMENRVEKSPRREQEMVSLTRDYENLKLSYDDLLKKKLDAEVSQNLEKRQKGEQFQILDPANLPQKPFTPNRPRVFGIAFAAALLAGFGGAIGLELVNPTLRGKRDFQHFFNVPVLASIPVIRDTDIEARKNVKTTVIYSGLISFGALLTLFLVVFGHKVRNLLMGMF